MEVGWKLLIETTNGNVGLWTGWLGNQFKVFYPLDVEIPDKTIMETLNVTLAKPVKDEIFGTRLWEKYYSERLEEGGRVWIGQTSSHSYGENLYSISDKDKISNYFGYERSTTIFTSQFTFYNENQPDAPSASVKNIMPYKEKFIDLAIKVAKLVGDIKAIDFESGPVLYTPEQLESLGYNVVKFRDHYYTKDDNVEIILLEGNSIVPWRTLIRQKVTNEQLTVESFNKFINSFDEFEGEYNVVPLLATLCQYYG